MILPHAECKLCHYRWIPRVAEPKRCPQCGVHIKPRYRPPVSTEVIE